MPPDEPPVPPSEPTTITTTPPPEPPKPTEGAAKTGILNEPPDKPPPGPSAPEKYEAFKTPDGFVIDDESLPEIHTMFKDLRLPQGEAQRLIDYYAKKSLEAANAPVEYYQEMQEKWVNEIKADSEIGGKLDQVKTTIGRALDSLGDSKLANEFRAAMDFTGAGNHPAFVKVFYRMAQRLTEGTTHVGGAPRGANERPKSAAQAIYPNLPSSTGG